MTLECNCDHAPCEHGCGDILAIEGGNDFPEPSYLWTEEYTLRSTALSHAVAVIESVNQTTPWVPNDTSLMDLFYDFLKGQSTPDPGAAVTAADPE